MKIYFSTNKIANTHMVMLNFLKLPHLSLIHI